MIMKHIKGTDLNVSAICMGNGHMKGNKTEEEGFRLLDLYADLGGNIVDTARIYNFDMESGLSLSEQRLGKWMKSRKNRNKLVVTTKGAHPFPANDTKMRLKKEEIRFDLHESLKTLGVDHIDLYWLHRDDPDIPVAEIIGTLDRLVTEGKIRYYGCSNWKPERIRGADTFCANQLSWSAAKIKTERLEKNNMCSMDGNTFKLHLDTGLTAFEYSSQAKGLFSILKEIEPDFVLPDRYSEYKLAENRLKFKNILKLAEEKNATPTQIALAWLLKKPFVSIPIIGTGNPEHVREAMGAVDISLSEDEVNSIGIW